MVAVNYMIIIYDVNDVLEGISSLYLASQINPETNPEMNAIFLQCRLVV